MKDVFFILTVVLLVLATVAFAQEKEYPTNFKVNNTQQPTYIHGNDSLENYLTKAVENDETIWEEEDEASYTISLAYTVDTGGNVTQVEVIESIKPSVDSKIVNKLETAHFKPAKAEGLPVEARRVDTYIIVMDEGRVEMTPRKERGRDMQNGNY